MHYKQLIIVFVFSVLKSYYSSGQMCINAYQLIEQIKSFKEQNINGQIVTDSLLSCKLRFIEFKSSGNIYRQHIVLDFILTSNDKKRNFEIESKCTALDAYSLVRSDQSIITVLKIKELNFDKYFYEIYIHDSKNIPQTGFVFDSNGKLIIEKQYEIKGDCINEYWHSVELELFIDNLNLYKLNTFEVKRYLTTVQLSLTNCFCEILSR